MNWYRGWDIYFRVLGIIRILIWERLRKKYNRRNIRDKLIVNLNKLRINYSINYNEKYEKPLTKGRF